jgi:hypothetical protein
MRFRGQGAPPRGFVFAIDDLQEFGSWKTIETAEDSLERLEAWKAVAPSRKSMTLCQQTLR